MVAHRLARTPARDGCCQGCQRHAQNVELIRGWQSERHVHEAMGEHRAEAARREAYEHARMLTPEQRGLRRAGTAAKSTGATLFFVLRQ